MNTFASRIVWATACLVVTIQPAISTAEETLDQSTGTTSWEAQGIGGWKYLAQSFVPGANMGRLLRVELWLERSGTPPSTLHFYLRSDASSTNIVRIDIDPSTITTVDQGQWHSLDMPAETRIDPGSKYWLVLHAADWKMGQDYDVSWFFAQNDYADGAGYITGNPNASWPPTGNWVDADVGDLGFRTYSEAGWSDVITETTVSETSDPITPPDSTTVNVSVKAGNENVTCGMVTLSVSPKEGIFGGGGSGPIVFDLADGQPSVTWTPPNVTTDTVYTFTASYAGCEDSGARKHYKLDSGHDSLTVNHVHRPSVTSVTAGTNDCSGNTHCQDNDIGIFIGGLDGWVEVNNTFNVSVSDEDGAANIEKVQLYIDGVLKLTDEVAPYQFVYDMSTLPIDDAELIIKVTDKQGLSSQTAPRTILTIAPPPWLFKGGGADRYMLNPTVTWNSATRTYRFTGEIPNNPELHKSQAVDIPYLGNGLNNEFQSDLEVVETFTTPGRWTYSVKGVLSATVLDAVLDRQEYPAKVTTESVIPPYARGVHLVSWSKPFELFDETHSVYDGVLATFWVGPVLFEVKLSVDFGFNATITVSGNLGPALTPDGITIAPTLSPYIDIDICLDMLHGFAKAGAKVSPTFSYTLPLIYSISHNPRLDWGEHCLEFVVKLKFYLDLLWGMGHFETAEQSYGHTDWPPGCSNSRFMIPSMVALGQRMGGEQSSPLKLFQSPSIAFDANGNGLALWVHDNDPTVREDPEIYFAVYRAGAWGAPQRLTVDQWWQTDPKVAFVGNGRAVVVWTQNTLTEQQGIAAGTIKQVLEAQDIYSSVWNGVAWSPPLPLTNDLGPVKPGDGRASLAGDLAGGRAIATWVRDSNGDPSSRNDQDIYYSVYQSIPAPNGSWSLPVRLGQVNAAMDAEPNVAFASNGSATCAWVRDGDSDPWTNGDRGVMVAQWTAAGGWSIPAALPASPGFMPPVGALWPSVTHDAGSNPVILFTIRPPDPSGGSAGEGFKDRLWWARLIGGQWTVRPSGGTGEGLIPARWPVAKLRPDNFVQVVYRTDTCTGLAGFDGDLGSMTVDVRNSYGEDSPGRVPSNDDVLDWQIDMAIDNAGNVQILWVRRGSDHPGATFGDGYDDLKLIVFPTVPNLALRPGSVSLDDFYPPGGATVTATATIENLNARLVAVPFQVNFYLDAVSPGNLLGTQVVNSMGPNAAATVALGFPAPAGSHTVLAVADAVGTVAESDETDNTGSTTLWPRTPPARLDAYADPSTGGIGLTWSASAMPQVGGYKICRSLTSGSGFALLGQTAGDVLTFSDTTVAPAKDYYYQVTTLDPWLVESDPSNEATANVGPDTDSDGRPDLADTDDDDDGMPDAWEEVYLLAPLDPADAGQDPDGDTFSNLEEFSDGTDPQNPASHRDASSPTTPVVVDDGTYNPDPSSLHATWSAGDPETGVGEYQYAVGTSVGGTEVLGWASAGTATEATACDLPLVDGCAYYFCVKARNGAGLWSDVGSSDGISQDASRPESPLVNDGPGADIDCQRSTNSFAGNWSGGDAESGIAHYWYAVGTGPRRQDVVAWTDAGTNTSASLGGLSLTDGAVCYLSVRAENGAGLSSIVSVSDGVLVQALRNPADLTDDCHVDQSDLDCFTACALGPAITQSAPTCAAADLDGDGDVDSDDFAVVQRCWSGPDLAPAPHCAD